MQLTKAPTGYPGAHGRPRARAWIPHEILLTGARGLTGAHGLANGYPMKIFAGFDPKICLRWHVWTILYHTPLTGSRQKPSVLFQFGLRRLTTVCTAFDRSLKSFISIVRFASEANIEKVSFWAFHITKILCAATMGKQRIYLHPKLARKVDAYFTANRPHVLLRMNSTYLSFVS